MEHLSVVTYNDQYSAVDNMDTLRKLDVNWVVDIRDAVAVARDTDGKLHIQDSYKPTTEAAAGWGVLLGTILGGLALAPFTGGLSTTAAAGAVAAGAAGGATLGGLTGATVALDEKVDYGISEDFVWGVSTAITRGHSALFALVAGRDPEQVAEYFRGTGGEILQTSLSPSEQVRVQQILSGKH